jgi:hypothetical protein
MASKDNAKSPAKRAREKLATLLAASDENGDTHRYDVWLYANTSHRLSANPDLDSTTKEELQLEIRRLSGVHGKEKRKYNSSELRNPDNQLFNAGRCLDLRSAVAAGNGSAVLEAVALCSAHGLTIPSWLASAFIQRYEAVVYGDTRGWGDEKAFGLALPKGAKVTGVEAEQQKAPWAYEVAKRRLSENPTQAIDGGFYSTVAKEIGSSQTNVQNWIGAHLCNNPRLVPLKFFKKQLLAGNSAIDAEIVWYLNEVDKHLQSKNAAAKPVEPTQRESQKVRKKVIVKT